MTPPPATIECPDCAGSGTLETVDALHDETAPCERCRGRGEIAYRATDRHIQTMYENGATGTEIARALSLNASTVYKSLKRMGVAMRPTGTMTSPRSDDEKIVAMYDSGMTCREIAIECHYSHVAIYRRLLALGVAMRSRGTRHTTTR